MDDLPSWIRAISALAPLIITIGAVTTATIAGTIAWKQGNRERWWKKVEWAIELCRSDDGDDQDLGLAVLDVLIDQAPSGDELALIGAASDTFLDRFAREGDTGTITYVLEDPESEAGDGNV